MKELKEWEKLHNFYKCSDYLTKDLANFLNVNPRTIQRWIKGNTKPNEEKLEKIKIYLSKRSSKDF